MPIRTLLSIYVLATALLGPFAVARPMPSTPSSQLQSSPASYNQIARREDNGPDYHRPHLQRRQQFSEPELLQIGRVGPDGQYLLRSEPHSTPGSAGLLVGTEFFDLPSLKFMTSSSPAPDPSQYSRYFLSLEVTMEFASAEIKNKAFASLRDLSYLRKECKRPNGFVNDLEYIDCALVIMKPYVVGQDKHRILDENWGRYKDNAISSSQPAAAPSAPPAPPSVAAIAPAPGSHAPSLPAPPSVAAPCSPPPGSLAPAPGSPAQIGQPAPVQIMQSACDSHSLPFFISKGPFSYLRVGRIDSKTNQWRSMYTALHRLDDIYVFLIDEHYFDYPSIAKTAATAEKASFPQAGGHPGKSSSPRHFIASLRTRVYLGEDTRKEVFETLRDLESLRVACGRTKKIEGNFDYADCAVNYVGNLDIIVNTYDDKDWKEVWNHIKDKRKKDLEAQAAREAAKAVRVTQAAAKARPS